eukprot:6183800-Pleurochrysis_carterae.AAC.2
MMHQASFKESFQLVASRFLPCIWLCNSRTKPVRGDVCGMEMEQIELTVGLLAALLMSNCLHSAMLGSCIALDPMLTLPTVPA